MTLPLHNEPETFFKGKDPCSAGSGEVTLAVPGHEGGGDSPGPPYCMEPHLEGKEHGRRLPGFPQVFR